MSKNDIESNNLIAEFKVPKTYGIAIFELVIYLIVIVSVIAAIFNLVFLLSMPFSSSIISFIWLVIVFFWIRSACKYCGGIKQYLIERVGVFARHQFAQIVHGKESQKILRFGYRLYGREYFYLQIQCSSIKTVDWGMGQAGENDWHVAIWFDKKHATTLDWAPDSDPGLDIYIIGPSGSREKTERFGQDFIQFLQEARALDSLPNEETLHDLVDSYGIISSERICLSKVLLDNNEYYAHSLKGLLEKGMKVKIVEKRGLSLYVLPISE